ncbi:MAG: hypothetical protein ACOCRK_03460 [bacterium]
MLELLASDGDFSLFDLFEYKEDNKALYGFVTSYYKEFDVNCEKLKEVIKPIFNNESKEKDDLFTLDNGMSLKVFYNA